MPRVDDISSGIKKPSRSLRSTIASGADSDRSSLLTKNPVCGEVVDDGVLSGIAKNSSTNLVRAATPVPPFDADEMSRFENMRETLETLHLSVSTTRVEGAIRT